MRHIAKPALSFILVADAASARTKTVSSQRNIDDADIVGADAKKIGDIEE